MQPMMGHREKLKGGDEWDVVRCRGLYKYLDRPGVAREVKRRLSRRARAEARQVLLAEKEGLETER